VSNSLAQTSKVSETFEVSSPDTFKPTELGDLPAEWDVVRLGDFVDKKIVRIKNGFPFGGFNEEGRGIPHLRPFNINTNASIDLSAIKYIETDRDLEAYFLQPGDVFFNNTNSEELVGKTTYWNRVGQFVYSNHMASIRVLDTGKLAPYFLMSYFHQRWREGYFQSLCRRHVNQASISLARIKQILIPLPPLDEQRCIAKILNTVQQAIAAQDDLIAAAQDVKRSLMRRLFTYGPTPEPAPTKETEIGEVPEHWEVVELGDVVEFASGQVDPRQIPYLKMPHIGPENVEEATGKILLPLKTAEDLDLISGKYLFTSEDVIYSKIRPYLRKVALPSFTGVCSADMYPLRLKGKLQSRRFLHQILLSEAFTTQSTSHQQRTGIPKINRVQLKSVAIPIPPPNEQGQIAFILQTADAKIAAEQDRRAALQGLFDSLLQELMTGRLRVRDLNFSTDNL
jgi:type I restriction enzyme S subunit